MSNKDEFLSTFNEMERFLRVEYHDGKFNEASFMGTLFTIRGKNQNELISNKDNFEVLSQAAQLRNIMVHNENIALPTNEFLQEFTKTVQKIIHPKTVFEIMNPISKATTASLDDTIDQVIQKMIRDEHSNIPIVDHSRLKGVFTKKTLYYYLVLYPMKEVHGHLRMRDILSAMDLDSNPAKYFDFVNKDASVYETLKIFKKDKKTEKELEILFVTSHGRKDEPILGIATLWDLDQAFMDE